MRRGVGQLVAVGSLAGVLACGRLGFDSMDAGPTDASPPSAAGSLPCNTATTAVETAYEADELHWFRDSAGERLGVVFHVTDLDHVIRRYDIEPGAPPTFVDDGVIYHGTSLFGSAAVDVGDHTLFAIGEVATGEGLVFRLVAGAAVAIQPVPGVVLSTPPLARAETGAIALVGVDAGAVVGFPIDTDGGAGAVVLITTTADNAFDVAAVAAAGGFAVTWHDQIAETCRVVMLDADLTIRAGPISFAPMVGAACFAPRAVWVPERQRLLVTGASSGSLWLGVYDADLNPGGVDQVAALVDTARIVANASEAWIVFDDRTSGAHDLRWARVDAQGGIHPAPVLARMYDPMSWPPSYDLHVVAGAPIAMWTDGGPPLAVSLARLCP